MHLTIQSRCLLLQQQLEWLGLDWDEHGIIANLIRSEFGPGKRSKLSLIANYLYYYKNKPLLLDYMGLPNHHGVVLSLMDFLQQKLIKMPADNLEVKRMLAFISYSQANLQLLLKTQACIDTALTINKVVNKNTEVHKMQLCHSIAALSQRAYCARDFYEIMPIALQIGKKTSYLYNNGFWGKICEEGYLLFRLFEDKQCSYTETQKYLLKKHNVNLGATTLNRLQTIALLQGCKPKQWQQFLSAGDNTTIDFSAQQLSCVRNTQKHQQEAAYCAWLANLGVLSNATCLEKVGSLGLGIVALKQMLVEIKSRQLTTASGGEAMIIMLDCYAKLSGNTKIFKLAASLRKGLVQYASISMIPGANLLALPLAIGSSVIDLVKKPKIKPRANKDFALNLVKAVVKLQQDFMVDFAELSRVIKLGHNSTMFAFNQQQLILRDIIDNQQAQLLKSQQLSLDVGTLQMYVVQFAHNSELNKFLMLTEQINIFLEHELLDYSHAPLYQQQYLNLQMIKYRHKLAVWMLGNNIGVMQVKHLSLQQKIDFLLTQQYPDNYMGLWINILRQSNLLAECIDIMEVDNISVFLLAAKMYYRLLQESPAELACAKGKFIVAVIEKFNRIQTGLLWLNWQTLYNSLRQQQQCSSWQIFWCLQKTLVLQKLNCWHGLASLRRNNCQIPGIAMAVLKAHSSIWWSPDLLWHQDSFIWQWIPKNLWLANTFEICRLHFEYYEPCEYITANNQKYYIFTIKAYITQKQRDASELATIYLGAVSGDEKLQQAAPHNPASVYSSAWQRGQFFAALWSEAKPLYALPQDILKDLKLRGQNREVLLSSVAPTVNIHAENTKYIKQNEKHWSKMRATLADDLRQDLSFIKLLSWHTCLSQLITISTGYYDNISIAEDNDKYHDLSIILSKWAQPENLYKNYTSYITPPQQTTNIVAEHYPRLFYTMHEERRRWQQLQ